MANALARGDRLPPELLREVVERADGVPLYVEEIVRFLEIGDRTREVPRTLRDLLTSRLDSLGLAKDSAQLAATIGREFDYRLLAAIYPADEASLLADLDEMTWANLLVRRRHVDSPVYLFRHALIRDAAYESMLGPARREIHGRVATALEQLFPQIVETRPELLAHHWAAGGDRRKAMGYTQRAAVHALSRSAYQEAAAHAQRGLEWLADCPDPRERAETELGLSGLLTPALMSTRGWAHEETRARIERAQELVESLGATPHAVPTLWGLLVYHHTRGVDRTRPRALVGRLLALAEESGATDLRIAGLCMAGLCSWAEGRLGESTAQLEEVLRLYDVREHRRLGAQLSIDPKMLAHNQLSQNRWMLRQPDRALEEVRAAVAWSRELGDANALTMSQWYAALLHHQRGEHGEAAALMEAMVASAARHGLVGLGNLIGLLRGAMSGDVEEARASLAGLEASGQELGLTYFGALVAETEAASGHLEEALARLEVCLARGSRSGEVYHFPEIHRLKGELLLRRDPAATAAAEDCFRTAILAARQQGVPLSEALAAARLTALQGQTDV
jgi:tetratricopeptide (TPR) repeat protein